MKKFIVIVAAAITFAACNPGTTETTTPTTTDTVTVKTDTTVATTEIDSTKIKVDSTKKVKYTLQDL